MGGGIRAFPCLPPRRTRHEAPLFVLDLHPGMWAPDWGSCSPTHGAKCAPWMGQPWVVVVRIAREAWVGHPTGFASWDVGHPAFRDLGDLPYERVFDIPYTYW